MYLVSGSRFVSGGHQLKRRKLCCGSCLFLCLKRGFSLTSWLWAPLTWHRTQVFFFSLMLISCAVFSNMYWCHSRWMEMKGQFQWWFYLQASSLRRTAEIDSPFFLISLKHLCRAKWETSKAFMMSTTANGILICLPNSPVSVSSFLTPLYCFCCCCHCYKQRFP